LAQVKLNQTQIHSWNQPVLNDYGYVQGNK